MSAHVLLMKSLNFMKTSNRMVVTPHMVSVVIIVFLYNYISMRGDGHLQRSHHAYEYSQHIARFILAYTIYQCTQDLHLVGNVFAMLLRSYRSETK